MQIPDVLTCAMALLLVAAATWGACHVAYGRRLKAMQRRLDKLNQTRLLYDRHGAQVRRQLDHLKRELDLQRAQQPWAPTPAAPPPVAGVRSAACPAASAGSEAGSELLLTLPADGFADTQPLSSRGFAPTRSMPTDGFAETQPLSAGGFAPTRPMWLSGHGAVEDPPSLPPDGFAATRPMPRPARAASSGPGLPGIQRLQQVG